MTEREKGFMNIIKDGLSYISKIISTSIFSPMMENTEIIIKNIEDRIVKIEKRILRKVSSLLVIGFGGILLIFSFFFFLREYLGWNNAIAFFSIGIIVFVIGLLLKIGEPGG